jgi:hypothetical protein
MPISGCHRAHPRSISPDLWGLNSSVQGFSSGKIEHYEQENRASMKPRQVSKIILSVSMWEGGVAGGNVFRMLCIFSHTGK